MYEVQRCFHTITSMSKIKNPAANRDSERKVLYEVMLNCTLRKRRRMHLKVSLISVPRSKHFVPETCFSLCEAYFSNRKCKLPS